MLGATASSSTTITINWTTSPDIFTNQFEITHSYTVRGCTAPPGSEVTVTIDDGTTRTHTLDNLNEDSTYNITVRAVNDMGQSAPVTTMANTDTSSKLLPHVIFTLCIKL